ncbi:MAG: ABC-type multidrug transport system ATPase subunit [Myxococcota bacterium]|jgi:ABC-2 type transport system ATP-binding protein
MSDDNDPVNALVVRGLTRRYGKRVVVKNLDLSVKQGDVYGFLGPNGAGKTTAMRCMLGLIKSHSGTVKIFGDTNLMRSHAHIGAIIESPVFHEWLSGRENLRLSASYANIPRRERKKAIDAVLTRVNLAERARDRVRGYSLGMKQRLAIARALLASPKLLFLDEPTNGLDPRGVVELREFIGTLATEDGITVFISSHQLAEVEAICNRVGIIHHGELRAEGNVAEMLMADHPLLDITASDPGALAAHCNERSDVTVVKVDRGVVRVRLDDIDAAMFNAALVTSGFEVSAFVPATRSLEDLFLEVTA